MGKAIKKIRGHKPYYEIYDQVVLKMLPFYAEMHSEIINLINRKRNDEFRIYEPGFGTGTLTARALNAFPMAQIFGVDNLKKNIKKAEEKMRRRKNFSCRLGDFKKIGLDEKYDYIISALAVHHLNGAEKKNFFKKSYKALNAGGKIIIGDIVKSKDEEQWHKYLIESMGAEGEYRWQKHKSNQGDKPSKIESQLKWLKAAGYKKVRYTKKWFNFYVFCGEKI